MTKLETRIIRAIFETGRFTATKPAHAEKAAAILADVCPHRIQCVDRSDDMGAFCQSFIHTDRIKMAASLGGE